MRISICMLTISLLSVGHWIPVMAQSREINETVPLSAGSNLVLDADKGSIKLTSWDQEKVEIYARIEAPRDVDREYAEEVVAATRIDIESDAGSLRIRTNFDDIPYEDDWRGRDRNRRIPDVHYEIRAPRILNMDLNIDRNRATVEGFEGAFRIETDRCDVDASDWIGDIQLNMDRGELRLVRASGSLDIETDRTDVRIEMLGLTGNSRFDADRGDVEISLPEAQGFSLRADVGNRGDFHSDFAVTTQSLRKFKIEGVVNGGGPELRFDGDRATFRLRHN